MSLKGTAAITGIAEMAPTKTPPPDAELDLMAGLVAEALADAGLEHDDVDGLFAIPPRREMFFPSLLSEHLGLRPTVGEVVDLGGASAAGMVWRAAAAIATGMCRVAVGAMVSVIDPARFARAAAGGGGGGRRPPLGLSEYEAPFGPMGVNTAYALAARRHMHEFGTTSEQLAKIAVDQRTNALANPLALYGAEPLTVDDVLASRLVVDPLHLLEIVRPCSGGVAFVMVAPDVARASTRAPAWLLGAGERIGHNAASFAPTLTTTPVAEAAHAAYAMAGVGPSDIDPVSVYDCYTIMVLLTLEDAGFCPKGKGGPFVEEHDLTYRGDLPVNTHGGQLSFGQPGIAGGASHITEAVRQLRGEAGARQLATCDLAFVNGNGGTMSEEVSLVLGSLR
jgi:acetyl-CoA acetyltransferase